MSPLPTLRSRNGEIPDFSARLQRARLGLGLGVAMVAMTFAVFTATYVLRRFSEDWPGAESSTSARAAHWTHLQLPIGLLLGNTFLLLLSSATMEMARRQVTKRAALAPVERIPGVTLGKERDLPWLAATIALGGAFVLGQVLAWRSMAAHGIYLAATPNATFAYLATILHAVHLGAGWLALLGCAGLAVRGASWDSQRIVVDISGWYWHFMAGLWLYLFGLVVVMS